MKQTEIVYLAVPYSHPDELIRELRFRAATRIAAAMTRKGYLVFSPITHTHPIAQIGDLPRGWDYWERFDRAMLGACTRLAVLMLDGWSESVGVQAEIALAKELGMPIEFLGEGPDNG